MNIFFIFLITVGWLFSIYFISSWRMRSRKKSGGILVSAMHDSVIHSYVMVSGVALLVLMIYLI